MEKRWTKLEKKVKECPNWEVNKVLFQAREFRREMQRVVRDEGEVGDTMLMERVQEMITFLEQKQLLVSGKYAGLVEAKE